MENLIEKIYYLDTHLFEIIKTNFALVDEVAWYELYKSKIDNSYWRLDKYDRLQQQYFVRLDSNEKWDECDCTELMKKLLKEKRGLSESNCGWVKCENRALNGLVFCEKHAYDMGVR